MHRDRGWGRSRGSRGREGGEDRGGGREDGSSEDRGREKGGVTCILVTIQL